MKQVTVYFGKEAFECKFCAYSEAVVTERHNETVVFCHVNYDKSNDVGGCDKKKIMSQMITQLLNEKKKWS